jgi:hypothetical protein
MKHGFDIETFMFEQKNNVLRSVFNAVTELLLIINRVSAELKSPKADGIA